MSFHECPPSPVFSLLFPRGFPLPSLDPTPVFSHPVSTPRLWLHLTGPLQVLQPIPWPTTSVALGLCTLLLVNDLLRVPLSLLVLSSLETSLSVPYLNLSCSSPPYLSGLSPLSSPTLSIPSLVCLLSCLGQRLWRPSRATMVSNCPFMNPISMSTRGQQAQVLPQQSLRGFYPDHCLSRPQPPALRPTVPFWGSPPPALLRVQAAFDRLRDKWKFQLGALTGTNQKMLSPLPVAETHGAARPEPYSVGRHEACNTHKWEFRKHKQAMGSLPRCQDLGILVHRDPPPTAAPTSHPIRFPCPHRPH